jgi:hypothetical protein
LNSQKGMSKLVKEKELQQNSKVFEIDIEKGFDF